MLLILNTGFETWVVSRYYGILGYLGVVKEGIKEVYHNSKTNRRVL